jgi:hypothetical protein
MQDIIDKMYEDGFHPDKLSKSERQFYEALWDQAHTLIDRLEEIEENLYNEENEISALEEAEENRREEYEMHKAIVGRKQADYDFNNQYTDESIDDDYNTFRRED